MFRDATRMDGWLDRSFPLGTLYSRQNLALNVSLCSGEDCAEDYVEEDCSRLSAPPLDVKSGI